MQDERAEYRQLVGRAAAIAQELRELKTRPARHHARGTDEERVAHRNMLVAKLDGVNAEIRELKDVIRESASQRV